MTDRRTRPRRRLILPVMGVRAAARMVAGRRLALIEPAKEAM